MSENLDKLDRFITDSKDEMTPGERAISYGLVEIARKLDALWELAYRAFKVSTRIRS